MNDWQKRMTSASLRPHGVEVRATLAGPDALAGERVLEDLLEAQELDDRQIDGRVEAQAALVGAEGAGEFHAVAAVDLNPAPVVDPGNPEHDLPFRFAEALENVCVGVFGMPVENRAERVQDLLDGLLEHDFACAATSDRVEDVVQVRGNG